MPYIIFKDYPGQKYKCSIRLIRICADNRINRLSDFIRLTFKEMLSLPECGDSTALTVKAILKENGLDFRKKPNSDTCLNQINNLIIKLLSQGQSYTNVSEKTGISPTRVQHIFNNRCHRSTSTTRPLSSESGS